MRATNYCLSILAGGLLLFGQPALAQQKPLPPRRTNVPTDSIRLSDPFILADQRTHTYYMTGTGGLLWQSQDLKSWDGPSQVARPDPKSWMGPAPQIWAAEIHPYKGKYYYFATFTNRALKIDTDQGGTLERRAVHVLVSDQAAGPYRPLRDETYLPATKSTLDGTFWVEASQPYLLYCHEWVQNQDGTVEKIALKPDLSGTTGPAQILFRASDSPWSRENPRTGPNRPNKVTDGPWVFRTKTGKLGMLWTSWVYDVYTQGVAYSASGTLAGPWQQERASITPPNYGHGMIFRTFEGQDLLVLHSHEDHNGDYHRVPHFFEADLSGDKLVIGKAYEMKN